MTDEQVEIPFHATERLMRFQFMGAERSGMCAEFLYRPDDRGIGGLQQTVGLVFAGSF